MKQLNIMTEQNDTAYWPGCGKKVRIRVEVFGGLVKRHSRNEEIPKIFAYSRKRRRCRRRRSSCRWQLLPGSTERLCWKEEQSL